MDPTREPQPAARPTTPSDIPADDTVVAYLRAHAPGLPSVRFDARAVTAHARGVLRRQRQRQLIKSTVAAAGAAIAYLGLALAGPVTVPGFGPVSVPGSGALQAMVASVLPDQPPGPEQWPEDVDRLESELLPVIENLHISYYLLASENCRVLEYQRGNFRDGDAECQDLVPFDAQARADFDEITRAVERTSVAVERIRRHAGAVYIPVKDSSWQYNWEYAYLPGVDAPPATHFPEEEWTHIRGDWWFHRAHDD
jgi:hypothetical protein